MVKWQSEEQFTCSDSAKFELFYFIWLQPALYCGLKGLLVVLLNTAYIDIRYCNLDMYGTYCTVTCSLIGFELIPRLPI